MTVLYGQRFFLGDFPRQFAIFRNKPAFRLYLESFEKYWYVTLAVSGLCILTLSAVSAWLPLDPLITILANSDQKISRSVVAAAVSGGVLMGTISGSLSLLIILAGFDPSRTLADDHLGALLTVASLAVMGNSWSTILSSVIIGYIRPFLFEKIRQRRQGLLPQDPSPGALPVPTHRLRTWGILSISMVIAFLLLSIMPMRLNFLKLEKYVSYSTRRWSLTGLGGVHFQVKPQYFPLRKTSKKWKVRDFDQGFFVFIIQEESLEQELVEVRDLKGAKKGIFIDDVLAIRWLQADPAYVYLGTSSDELMEPVSAAAETLGGSFAFNGWESIVGFEIED